VKKTGSGWNQLPSSVLSRVRYEFIVYLGDFINNDARHVQASRDIHRRRGREKRNKKSYRTRVEEKAPNNVRLLSDDATEMKKKKRRKTK